MLKIKPNVKRACGRDVNSEPHGLESLQDMITFHLEVPLQGDLKQSVELVNARPGDFELSLTFSCLTRFASKSGIAASCNLAWIRYQVWLSC